MNWTTKDYHAHLARQALPPVSHPEPSQQAGTLVGNHAGEAPRAGRPHVRFTLRRVKFLDWDAKYGSVKDLLDGLVTCGLLPGDREDQITGEVVQEKVHHFKDEETIIEIYTP